jgi:hypothetical protein
VQHRKGAGGTTDADVPASSSTSSRLLYTWTAEL